MFVAGSSMKEIVNLKTKLAKVFSMKDSSPAKKILGMAISREKKRLNIITSRVRGESDKEV